MKKMSQMETQNLLNQFLKVVKFVIKMGIIVNVMEIFNLIKNN